LSERAVGEGGLLSWLMRETAMLESYALSTQPLVAFGTDVRRLSTRSTENGRMIARETGRDRPGKLFR